MKKTLFYLVLFSTILLITCQKELSHENGGAPSHGSLLDNGSGDCLPKTINGTYIEDTVLNAANTIQVTVNVTKTGNYTIFSDTVNGYYFRATGIFATVGSNSVTLVGHGTPAASGINNFLIQYDSSACNVAVTVLPAGTGPATFSLTGSGSTCGNASFQGSYTAGTSTNSSNTLTVEVNVATIGTYSITATSTGTNIQFNKTGSFTATGTQSVILNSNTVTPPAAGTFTFNITAGSSSCTKDLTINSAGSAAVYSLIGSPTACSGAFLIAGSYTQGVALTASDTVRVQVNVTTPGTYSLTTNTPPVNGITFAASGSFSSTGTQTVVMTATGQIPTNSGPFNYTVTGASTSCTFSITYGGGSGGAAVFAVDCSSAVVNGYYEQGSQLNPCNTVDIDVNVATPGTYTITGTAGGMTFSKSGTFSTAGVTNIRLQGSGTPTTYGTVNVFMPGTSACTFPVTVDAAGPSYDWHLTINGTPNVIYRGQTDASDTLMNSGYVIFELIGSNSLGSDDFEMVIADANGTINVNETYNTSSLTGNLAAFLYQSECSSDPYQADPSISGVSIIFKVTSHNTTTKTITGTFSGTAKNSAGQTVTIASGDFTGTY